MKNFGNNPRKKKEKEENEQEFERSKIKEWNKDEIGNLQNPYNEL